MNSILISVLCVMVAIFIFYTQSDFSSIKIPNKDASLILLVFGILAYVNKHEILFLILLVLFMIIYFIDANKIKGYLNPIFKVFSDKKEEKKVKENKIINEIETTVNTENTNEFTIDDNIDE